MSEKKSVFISYRNDDIGPSFAQSLLQSLRQRGFDVFLDVNDMGAGEWLEMLQKQISESSHFLLLLTPKALDRCDEPGDMVRWEYESAVKARRNIVPVFYKSKGHDITTMQAGCPPAMLSVFAKQIVQISHGDFESGVRKLTSEFISPDKAPKDDVFDDGQVSRAPIILFNGDLTDATSEQPVPVSALVSALNRKLSGAINCELQSKVHSLPLDMYQLLTCEAAAIVIDRKSLQSKDLAAKAQILAWRRELGLPLVLVFIDGLRPKALKTTSIRFMEDLPWILETPLRRRTPLPPDQVADKVSDLLNEEFRRRSSAPDPTLMWLNEAEELLGRISETKLRGWAEYLMKPLPPGLGKTDLLHAVSAMLFVADLKNHDVLKSVYGFLNYAANELGSRGGVESSPAARLVGMVLPMWVDIDAGRELLRSSKTDQLCGLRLSNQRFAKHVIQRASAGARGYVAVDLGSPATGEHAALELEKRYAATLTDQAGLDEEILADRMSLALRAGLELENDETTEYLSLFNDATFAIFDPTSLTSNQLINLIDKLRERFPEVAFVLVSDCQDDKWRKINPPVQIAIDRQDKNTWKIVVSAVHHIQRLAATKPEA